MFVLINVLMQYKFRERDEFDANRKAKRNIQYY